MKSNGRVSKLPTVSRNTDWFSEGESKVVEADGVEVTVKFVKRKGRRGRIEITAPAGAVFRSLDASDAPRESKPM
ncbi:MAG: hypothetical protein HY000_00075 [Planctomycetes bacterium]|nr:hypothetical protein [Planctomycetota bacterium]